LLTVLSGRYERKAWWEVGGRYLSGFLEKRMTGGSPYYVMLLGLRAGAKKTPGQAALAPNLTKLDKSTNVESQILSN
jgi:hypothetical protein